MMLLFNTTYPPVPPGATIDFWKYWWFNIGILMIVITAIGVVLIVVGIWLIHRSKRRLEV